MQQQLLTQVRSRRMSTDKDCSLECMNGGTCIPGASSNNNTSAQCDCPSGYSGLQCDIAVDLCGENQHPCYNGATCVVHAKGESSYCDCSSAASLDRAYAGHFCQHVSTVFCAAPAAGEHLPKHTFCTNGGTCKQIVNPDKE